MRHMAAADALRTGVLLHEYGDQSTCYFHHLHRQRQQATFITHLQQQQGSPVADLCTMHGRQQADRVIVNYLLADSPTGMFRQLPTFLSARQSDRQLPSDPEQAWEGAEQGGTLDELQAAVKLFARGTNPETACRMSSTRNSWRCLAQLSAALQKGLHDSRGHHLAVRGQGLEDPVGSPPQQRLKAANPLQVPALGQFCSA